VKLTQDYFELFGLAREFEIDADLLVHRYRDLQRVLHPDKYVNASDQERRMAMQQAAHVNAGYQTLKDPLARARYLLSLEDGGEGDPEQATIRDVGFLEEQMELRETLMEIRADADPQGGIFHFLAELNSKEKDYIKELSQAFAAGDSVALARANNLVQRLQFVRRLQQEAEAIEEELL